MSFIGSPSAFDAPRQPTGESSAKAEPLAKESTLQGIRSGISLMSSDLVSLNTKIGDKGAIYGILTDIADILDTSAIARHSDSPLEKELQKITQNTGKANLEQKLETKVSDLKAERIEKNQTSLLKAINENVIKSMGESGIFNWFKDNWGKLLLAAGVLLLPMSWWKKIGSGLEIFWNMPLWGKLFTALGVITTWILGKAAIKEAAKAAVRSALGLPGSKETKLKDKAHGKALKENAKLDKKLDKARKPTAMRQTTSPRPMASASPKWKSTPGGSFLGVEKPTIKPTAPSGSNLAKSVGKTVLKVASKAAVPILIAIEGFQTFSSIENLKKKRKAGEITEDEATVGKAKAIGKGGGALAGALAGAAIGSIIPGIGTIVGGLVGSIVGGLTGSMGGEKLGEVIGKKLIKSSTIEKKIRGVGGAETPGFLPTGQMELADGRKNMSGWNGLSGQAKLNSQRMANMFGGLRITSGQRSQQQQAKAMMGMKSVDVYSSKWKGKLTKAERNSAPGTNERSMAIAKIMAAGYESKHKHGNAIDFSTPSAYIGRIPALRTVLEGAFPGSKLIEEGDHMHLAFEPGVSPDQLSAGMNKIHEGMGRGGFQGGPTYNINHHSQQNNVVAPQSTLITGDTVRDKSDK